MSKYDFKLDLDSENTMSVINSWIEENTNVLEFGPANGRLTKYLSKEKKCHVTIVEIDEKAGSQAARYAECAYLGKIEGDICNFYWIDNKNRYDYIIFADVLEHLSQPKLVLDRCRKVLKNDGKILISIPNIAHNSVLIDLFNDKFDYSNVGLLDKTHIHFFTYHTFKQMLEELNYTIMMQEPIYSRVGWNEIKNSYDDVSANVARELRKRRSGSVYQYVFCICDSKNIALYKENTFESIDFLEEDLTEEYEASCYYWPKKGMTDLFERKSHVYSWNGMINCKFSINCAVEKIRLDLIECPALINVIEINIKVKNMQEERVEIFDHNAEFRIGELLFFTDQDPWIELNLGEDISKEIEYVSVKFSLIDCSMSDTQIFNYSEIFREFTNNLDSNKGRAFESRKLERKISDKYEKTLDEIKGYNDHLENDIIKLKTDLISTKMDAEQYANHLECDIREKQAYIIQLEKDSSQKQEYIAHLEKDIKEQQGAIVSLKDIQSEQQEYIAHLEKDIKEQQGVIVSLKDIQSEQQEYIAHLEKDIEELKAYITHLEKQ